MKTRCTLTTACLLLLAAVTPAGAKEDVLLANHPSLSPDGQALAFDWNGDVWTVPTAGGVARQLTQHPGRDREPKFSPDGKEIAFISDRDGSPQVYVMPADGGTPRQLTYHTAGYSVQDWYPDGQSLLVEASRDHYWRHAERFFKVGKGERAAEQLLFDDYGRDGRLSPDGKRLLFTREGPAWWRKGYHGSQAGQVWLCDLDKKSFTHLMDKDDRGCLWPLWKPDGKGFYFVGGRGGPCFNLFEYDLQSNQARQLTKFEDDSVAFPCVSRDGSTVVFRRLFDLYVYRPGADGMPKKIDIVHNGDRVAERKERRVLQAASDVAFSADGLEVAFVAGGDLWVMDTELREPRQITNTPEEERHPVFAPDGEALLFASDKGGRCDVYKAERADKQKYWWQNKQFKVERLTDDGEVKSGLRWSPDGSKVSYLRGRGDLWVADADGKNARRLIESWSAPEYDWSPDGKWLVYAVNDNDFNRDIWVRKADGEGKPYNLSRHPYNEANPVWSPDGKVIAFSGRRASGSGEANICFVWLREEDEKSARDKALDKALDKINKVRKPGPGPRPTGGGTKDPGEEQDEPKTPPVKKGAAPEVVIDFERLHERVRRIALSQGGATDLFWAPDSTKFAFTGSFEGKPGTYTVDLAEDARPKALTTTVGTHGRWLRQGNQIVWLVAGVPSSFPTAQRPTTGTGGTTQPTTPPTTPPRFGRGATADTPAEGAGQGTQYRFQALQEVDVGKKNAAAFDLCWRTMRDHWYDERLGNRDWDAVRRKYLDVAGRVPDTESLSTVVQLMLGELNGSHLGFTAAGGGAGGPGRRPGRGGDTPTSADWQETTAHLGLRFDPGHKGDGLKVRDVLPGGPADKKKSRVEPGEIVLAIDGTPVGPAMDLTKVLNGPLARDIVLKVRGAGGQEREVTVRPISYTLARSLLYEKWLQDNRKAVEQASGGTLGYLHISAMSMPSFHKFEEELYSVGSGKDGLVIDVRENGGGSTADHLLTALTQPVHAITIPRGGGQGYPQDRKVYATWNKPIVVLCNQNSFSNAEIFSHAIKTLKRGPLVGVPTAGGVVSTGAAQIMDVGVLRLPTRGWFVVGDGQDMELNGAVPHHVLWPEPGQLPQGKDVQLGKAVEVLLGDVKAWQERPRPPLQKATERPAK